MPKVPLVAPAGKLPDNDCISADLAASYVIVSLVHTTIKLTNPNASIADVVKMAKAAKNAVFTELYATLEPQHKLVAAKLQKLKAKGRKVIGKRLHTMLAGKYTLKKKTATKFKLRKKTFITNNVDAVAAYQKLITFESVLQRDNTDATQTIDAQAEHLANAANALHQSLSASSASAVKVE